MNDMLRATGLWRKKSKKGTDYLAGRMGGVKVIIMPNTKRTNDNEPTHHMFFANGEKKQTGGS
jgi:hypothetical protein